MEREEGELTDEDLEDVSDNSSLSMVPIPMILSGKSPSLSANREPFRELSLTSVSDDSEDRELKYRIVTTRSRDLNHGICHKHQHHREERKHSGTKRVRKISERRVVRRRTSTLHKEYSSVSSSSDESEYYKKDKDILRQLRDAVRINRSQNLPNCSLRTRLKRMIEPDSHSQGSKNSNSEDDNDLDTLRDLALQSKSKKESETPNITDKDLIELRLIALQSAVLKKHQNRRKNKEELQKKIQSEANVEPNTEMLQHAMETDSVIKENTTDSVESKQEKIQYKADNNSLETINKINDSPKTNIDDDEAILRAVLLTNISNQDDKNTAEDNGTAKTVTEKSGDNEILRAMLISSIYNNNADSAHSNQENIQQNVDNNSNTCTTTEKTENTKTNIEEDEDILRAMLLANISKKIANKRTAKQTNNILSRNNTNLNKANGIVAKKVTNLNDIKNTVKVPAVPVNRFIINLNSDSDSDCDQTIIEKRKPEKSAKKSDLFDKSLSLFLQQARAKSDAEHKSDISHLPKSQQLEYRRLKRKLQQLTRSRLKTTTKTKKILVSPDENNKLNLVNINTKKDKSIVNQETKSALKSMPDEQQLNSKIDRLQVKGKYEELGPLMTRVSDARVARDKSQTEVKRLINDLRIARAELTSTHQTYTTLMQQLVKEKSLIDKRSDDQELEIKNLNNNPPVCTSTPNKVTLKENQKDISCELSAINESVQSNDDSAKVEIDKTVVPEMENIMEIEENPIEEEKLQSSILKYSSPLDHIQLNRAQSDSNPLSILCPYDLLGVCRDPGCSFRHCGNAITD